MDLSAFFSSDPTKVLAAVAAIEAGATHGAVTSVDHLSAPAGEDRLRMVRNGIFCPKIFGPLEDDRCACGTLAGAAARGQTCPRCGVLCDRASLRDERWGHVAVTSVVHPLVYQRADAGGVAEALGIELGQLAAVARGDRALRRDGEDWHVIDDVWTDEDVLVGPHGIALALERTAPGHPWRPLCALRTIPVPPPGRRPLIPPAGSADLDPAIGRTNEAWLSLVERATRETRLIELEAPAVIVSNERCAVQRAFDAVVARTREDLRAPLPPLRSVPSGLSASDATALATIDDRLLQQTRDALHVRDREGRILATLPPCGLRLRGVVGGRYAIFEEFFAETEPTVQPEDCGYGREIFSDDGFFDAARFRELSIVDCDELRYLDRLPPGLPLRFVRNDQPEEIFFSDDAVPSESRALRVGGDRPELRAYAPGMTHGWVDGELGVILDLARGTPAAFVARCEEDETELPVLRWADAAPAEDEEDEGGDGDETDDRDEEDDDEERDLALSASAIGFDRERRVWNLLWPDGVLADHRARRPAILKPAAQYAAFDPSGGLLLVARDEHFAWIDVDRREVVRRGRWV